MTQAPLPAGQPGRGRPAYLRPIGDPEEEFARANDHDHDHDRHDPPRKSDRHRIADPVSPPHLSPSQARLARFLELRVPQLTPRDQLHALDDQLDGATFHGADAFVLKFGPEVILSALKQLTYWRAARRYRDSQLVAVYVRHWSDEIVSPARRLAGLVKDLDQLSRQQQEGQP